jgi:hypothetical protein
MLSREVNLSYALVQALPVFVLGDDDEREPELSFSRRRGSAHRHSAIIHFKCNIMLLITQA